MRLPLHFLSVFFFSKNRQPWSESLSGHRQDAHCFCRGLSFTWGKSPRLSVITAFFVKFPWWSSHFSCLNQTGEFHWWEDLGRRARWLEHYDKLHEHKRKKKKRKLFKVCSRIRYYRMTGWRFGTLFKRHTFLLCPFYPCVCTVKRNVSWSRYNTEIASMRGRRRRLEGEGVREKMARWDGGTEKDAAKFKRKSSPLVKY